MNHFNPLTEQEKKFIEDNANLFTAKVIGDIIGRHGQTVRRHLAGKGIKPLKENKVYEPRCSAAI